MSWVLDLMRHGYDKHRFRAVFFDFRAGPPRSPLSRMAANHFFGIVFCMTAHNQGVSVKNDRTARAGQRFLVIHGEKPQKNCAPHPAFLARLDAAFEIVQHQRVDGIVVSGGMTRRRCVAEATFGATYLHEKGCTVPIQLEDQSLTTIENIQFTEKLLADVVVQELIVITSATRILRLKYLYRQIWPDIWPSTQFIGAPDPYGPHVLLFELAYLVYAFFDINELFLARVTKKLFRNSGMRTQMTSRHPSKDLSENKI